MSSTLCYKHNIPKVMVVENSAVSKYRLACKECRREASKKYSLQRTVLRNEARRKKAEALFENNAVKVCFRHGFLNENQVIYHKRVGRFDIECLQCIRIQQETKKQKRKNITIEQRERIREYNRKKYKENRELHLIRFRNRSRSSRENEGLQNWYKQWKEKQRLNSQNLIASYIRAQIMKRNTYGYSSTKEIPDKMIEYKRELLKFKRINIKLKRLIREDS